MTGPVVVDAAARAALAELAELDNDLARLAHRSRRLPEQLAHDEAAGALRAAEDRVAVLALAVADLDEQLARLDADLAGVAARADRDRTLIDSAGTDVKHLTDLEHELATLRRRQTSLEDTVLDVMQRREDLTVEHTGGVAALPELAGAAERAVAARDAALVDVDTGTQAGQARRADLVAALPPALAALYEKQRGSVGTGAGRLVGAQCGACRIDIDRGELARVRAAPDDALVRCPECGAILLRDPR